MISAFLLRRCLTTLLFSFTISVYAQRYILRDGRIIEAEGTTLRADQIVRAIPGYAEGDAEIAYPIANVARIEWPEPPELAEARQSLIAGQPEAALLLSERMAARFAPLASVPGSWWSEAALIQARALAQSDQSDAAGTLARQLVQTALTPEIAASATVILAEIEVAAGRQEPAIAFLHELSARSPGPTIEAQIQLLRGDLALQRGAAEAALEAYLQVPAFFGALDEFMPRALLGSARAYRAYGDPARSKRAYTELMGRYGNSSEAAHARVEFQP